MPPIQVNTQALQLTLAGGTEGTLTGGTGVTSIVDTQVQTNTVNWIGWLNIGPLPTQIVGFNPLMPCIDADCRISPQITCYFNPVFGVSGQGGSTYENDLTPFWLNSTPGTIPQWCIEKLYDDFWTPKNVNNGTWQTIATISDNTYGIYTKLGSLAAHPTYSGFTANWGKIIPKFGEGIYRIQVNGCVTNFTPNTLQICNLAALALQDKNLDGGVYTTDYNGFLYVGKIDFSIGASFQNNLSYVNNDIAYINAIISVINSTPSCGVSAAADASGLCIIFTPIGAGAKPAANVGNPLILFSKTNQWLPWINGMQGTKATNPSQFSNLGNIPAVNSGTTTTLCECALVSEPYLARNWDCIKADGTTKFEVNLMNSVSNFQVPGTTFDLTGMNLYDSIRMRGKFHDAKYTYEELILEYGANLTYLRGYMQRIRDKVITGWDWEGFDLPEYVHARFAKYGLTAAYVYISDYNFTNPDYNLKHILVMKAGSYEAEYLDNGRWDKQSQYRARLGSVKVKFVEGVQSMDISNYYS